jgi:ABC-type glycerol-3-phosphate transport system substrate-binding protein
MVIELSQDKLEAMTLRRLAMITLTFLFLISVSLLLLAHGNGAYYEKLTADADAAITTANNTSIVVEPQAARLEERAIDKSIQNPGSVKVVYVSSSGQKLMIAYYSQQQIIEIDQLDFREEVVRRDIFDPQHRLRVRIWFNTQNERTQMDYLDEKGNPFDRYKYFPALSRGTGLYP